MTVDEAIIKQETLDFLQVAERYCVFVETETTKGIEYHFKARDMLTTLYATAIRFPEVAITSDKEFNNRVTNDQQQNIIQDMLEIEEMATKQQAKSADANSIISQVVFDEILRQHNEWLISDGQ